jgi:hypothetical protein
VPSFDRTFPHLVVATCSSLPSSWYPCHNTHPHKHTNSLSLSSRLALLQACSSPVSLHQIIPTHPRTTRGSHHARTPLDCPYCCTQHAYCSPDSCLDHYYYIERIQGRIHQSLSCKAQARRKEVCCCCHRRQGEAQTRRKKDDQVYCRREEASQGCRCRKSG